MSNRLNTLGKVRFLLRISVIKLNSLSDIIIVELYAL